MRLARTLVLICGGLAAWYAASAVPSGSRGDALRSRAVQADDAPAGQSARTASDAMQGAAAVAGTLVFQSDREGRTGIYTLDIASRRVARLTGSPTWSEATPRWSPDGRRVAFASNRAHYEGATPEPGAPDFDLYVVNADGTGLSRVTSAPANEQDPSWAPDGASLYYWSDEGSRGDLYRVWIGTGRVERLTRQFVGRALMPSASPDGTRVAFAAQTLRLGQFWAYQVHLLDVARGTTAALAASSGACWPAWSPDGARLAHVRLAEGRPSALEIRTLATGASSALVDDPVTWSYYPAWSRDGRFVAFSTSPAHHEGEDWDLAVVEVATRRVTRLTTGRGNDRLPDWKP